MGRFQQHSLHSPQCASSADTVSALRGVDRHTVEADRELQSETDGRSIGKLCSVLRTRLNYEGRTEVIIQAYIDAGQEPPEDISCDLWPVARPYYNAWHELHRSRQWASGGMGPAIPIGLAYSEIAAYARDAGYVGDSFREFVQLMGAMDAVYFECFARKVKT